MYVCRALSVSLVLVAGTPAFVCSELPLPPSGHTCNLFRKGMIQSHVLMPMPGSEIFLFGIDTSQSSGRIEEEAVPLGCFRG